MLLFRVTVELVNLLRVLDSSAIAIDTYSTFVQIVSIRELSLFSLSTFDFSIKSSCTSKCILFHQTIYPRSQMSSMTLGSIGTGSRHRCAELVTASSRR